MWTFARHRTLAAEDYYSNEICLLDKTTAQQVKHTREIKKLHVETLLWKIYSLCAISKAKLSPVAMWKLFSPAEAFIMFFSLLLWLSALLSLRYHLLLSPPTSKRRSCFPLRWQNKLVVTLSWIHVGEIAFCYVELILYALKLMLLPSRIICFVICGAVNVKWLKEGTKTMATR